MVALLSNIEGAEHPIISLETNSSLISNLICSTNGPSSACVLIKLLMCSIDVALFTSKFKIANEPFGTGTLMAFEVSLPSSCGKALLTALPAPVSVITILSAAARPRRYLL